MGRSNSGGGSGARCLHPEKMEATARFYADSKDLVDGVNCSGSFISDELGILGPRPTFGSQHLLVVIWEDGLVSLGSDH